MTCIAHESTGNIEICESGRAVSMLKSRLFDMYLVHYYARDLWRLNEVYWFKLM